MKLLQAKWVAPMAGPLLRDGAVVFDERRIIAVGPAGELRSRYAEAEVHDAGASLILPGLVNAHTHLELTDCARPALAGGNFTDWIWQLILARGRLGPEELAEAVDRSVAQGVAQCLKFGVTTVGDITRQCEQTRPRLARSPLRVVSYGEVQALAQRRGLLEERLRAALENSCAGERLIIGLTPHAPYTVEPEAYRRCLRIAQERGLPLATHLAETPEERTFLAEHAGPLRELWDRLGWWDEQVPRFEGGPVRLAAALGLLDHPTLLAHVNYCDDEEMALLAAGQASVVYNPRTHAYFGHPPHRWREMLARGINVAVGTDSCASSPDLNLVDELRLLRKLAPDIPAATLWEMATVRAARALCLPQAGVLAPGRFADLTIFPAGSDHPLEEVLDQRVLPAESWIAGRCVSRNGVAVQ